MRALGGTRTAGVCALAILGLVLVMHLPAGTWAFERLSASNGPQLWFSPDTLTYSGQALTLYWSGIAQPQPDDFVAIYAPSTRPLDLYQGYFRVDAAHTWASGSGQFVVELVNMRNDYIFALWVTDPTNSSAKVVGAVSNPLKFSNQYEPTQVHLAMGEDPTQMSVMWVSADSVNTPYVNYGSSSDMSSWSLTAGISYTYTVDELCAAPGNLSVNWQDPGTLHDVMLKGLQPATTYYYRVGNPVTGWSPIYRMTTPPAPGAGIDIAAYGDLGVGMLFNVTTNAGEQQAESRRTIGWVQESGVQMALHIGDISYARGFAMVWDYFFDLIEPVASAVPYMVCIGNHEYDYIGQPFKPNWSDYNTDSGGECGVPYTKRFHMPGPDASRNLWYSFNFGNTHFVLMSTEHDFLPGSAQYEWIVADLAAVDRKQTPWVIFSGHRPMYDTSSDGPNYGPVKALREALEPVLVQYKVNLALWGHVHKYERTCGINNFTCADDDSEAPVHVVIGMAGNDYQDPWMGQGYNHWHVDIPEWMVFRTMNYGYSRIRTNSTHLHFQFLNNQRNEVHDEFFLHV